MAYTRDWSESTPLDHSKFKAQPGHVRELKVDISDRLKNFYYGFTAGETSEGVKKLTFYAQGTAPSSVANAIIGFGSDWAGKCEFTFLGEDGTFIQATRLGKLLLDSGILTNQAFLIGVNAAGTGTANIIKLNASDLPELPDGALLASGTAPTTDAAVANKKYVDDQIATKMLGAWASKSKNTVYQAATDGFVTAKFTTESRTVHGKTDGSNPPTTVRLIAHNYSNCHSGDLTLPVKKDDYWEIEEQDGSTDLVVYWIPFG